MQSSSNDFMRLIVIDPFRDAELLDFKRDRDGPIKLIGRLLGGPPLCDSHAIGFGITVWTTPARVDPNRLLIADAGDFERTGGAIGEGDEIALLRGRIICSGEIRGPAEVEEADETMFWRVARKLGPARESVKAMLREGLGNMSAG